MRKQLWGILGISVLSLGGTGIWGYEHFFNREVTPKELHVADDFFDFSGLLVPDSPNGGAGSTSTPTGKTQGVGAAKFSHSDLQQNAPGNAFGNASVNESTNETASTEQATSNVSRDVTVDQIEAKYSPVFRHLQSEASSRLDQLVVNAKSEYRASKKNGTPSTSELVSKYTSAARKLQSAVDGAFYQLLGQMKNELSQANLSLDLVSKAQNEYESAKQTKRSELFAKVKL